MREMIRGLRGKHTILLSSHILSEIEQTCDRILVLHQGRIAAHGSEQDLAKLLTGGEVELVVRADEAALRAALSKVSGLSEIRVQRGDATGGGPYRGAHDPGVTCVRIKADRDVRADLASAVVKAGLPLLELSAASGGLEGIFLQLTQGKGSALSGKEVRA
jgi:ABC-2 type transport system ATP-binding protein